MHIIGLSPARKLLTLTSSGSANDVTTCVAWAPSCGRSYQLIATGGRDGKVRIWKVHPPSDTYYDDEDIAVDGEEEDGEQGKWEATETACFDSHGYVVPILVYARMPGLKSASPIGQ